MTIPESPHVSPILKPDRPYPCLSNHNCMTSETSRHHTLVMLWDCAASRVHTVPSWALGVAEALFAPSLRGLAKKWQWRDLRGGRAPRCWGWGAVPGTRAGDQSILPELFGGCPDRKGQNQKIILAKMETQIIKLLLAKVGWPIAAVPDFQLFVDPQSADQVMLRMICLTDRGSRGSTPGTRCTSWGPFCLGRMKHDEAIELNEGYQPEIGVFFCAVVKRIPKFTLHVIVANDAVFGETISRNSITNKRYTWNGSKS